MAEGGASGPKAIPAVSRLAGTVAAPPSKSATQRALVAASLARGVSRIRRPLLAGDAFRMAGALTAVGVPVRFEGEGEAAVAVVDGRGGAVAPAATPVDVGDAGTAMRFLTARLAAEPVSRILDGSPRMRQRPIEDLLAALRGLGAQAVCLGKDGCPPVRVGGRGMAGGVVRLPGGRSSQFLSALLLAGPAAARGITVEVAGDLVSRPYVDLTLDVMRRFGVAARPAPPTGDARVFTVPPAQAYQAGTHAIEGDYSSASYFFAAAAIVPGTVTVANLDPRSLQGDARFLGLLEEMGCRVTRGADRVTVRGPDRLRGIEADLGAMPDVAPTLAAVALFAGGPTRISGVPHLRIKESDRIAALGAGIAALGGEAEPRPDGLVVRPRPLGGAPIDPRGDHRMAMAFAVAGLRVRGVVILDPACVSKSYPGFWSDLDRLLAASA